LTGAANSAKPNGEIGGLHVGYNYQISQFVVGLEGDVDGLSFSNSVNNPATGFFASTRIPVEGSIRGRVGYAWDRALFFVTGGAAFADIQHQYALAGVFSPSGTFDKTRVGYTFGGGVEYALSNNWSVRGEYRYANFGGSSDSYVFGPGFATAAVTSNRVIEHSSICMPRRRRSWRNIDPDNGTTSLSEVVPNVI
jgi:outer membrane immunogenic protein